MDERELSVYQESLKDYWDLKSSMDTYYGEGIIEGEKKKAIEIAKNLLKTGIDLEIISSSTGLTKSEIEKLK